MFSEHSATLGPRPRSGPGQRPRLPIIFFLLSIMNRNLVTLGFLLVAAPAAHAQFGLTAGANFATLSTKSDDHHRATAKGQPGYQVGVFYEKKLASRWSGLLGLSYSRQTTNLSVEEYGIADGGYGGSYRLDLGYLSLPMLVRRALGHFYLEAGPQVSILQTAHEQGTEVFGTFGGPRQQDFDRRATDRYRRFDVGLCAGLGAQMPAGFSLALRATTGFLSLTHVAQWVTYAGRLRTQVVQASLSYRFKAKP